jgi:hypothetical protein
MTDFEWIGIKAQELPFVAVAAPPRRCEKPFRIYQTKTVKKKFLESGLA